MYDEYYQSSADATDIPSLTKDYQNIGPDRTELWLMCAATGHKSVPTQIPDEGLAICWNSPVSVEFSAVGKRFADEVEASAWYGAVRLLPLCGMLLFGLGDDMNKT
jgi:hypothetical protein